MRLHRVEMTAFGPFAGTETVDFEPLNDAGMFLLTGRTGAGKTTILDAICFGLFGAVPGDRNSAKDLKSHHSHTDSVPQVVLEVTLRSRRFRIRRSPAWTRPSRRARSGSVDQAAKASVEEFVDGRWVSLSARVDEVGHLVTRVLGMNRDQFCQVVMLPQGLFQTFLRSGAKERHDVLESLFETRRFGRIETWLSDRRRDCDRAVACQQGTICQLLARASEVGDDVGVAVDVSADRDTFSAAVRALAELSDEAEAAAVTARQHDAGARTRLKEAQHALDSARDLHGLQVRHASGRESLRELEAVRDVVLRRADRLRHAEAARSLAPLLALLTDSERALGQVSELVTKSLAECSEFADGASLIPLPDQVESAVAAQRDELARLQAMVDTERAVEGLTARARTAELELAQLEARCDSRRSLASALPALLAQARDELRRESEVAEREPAARAQLAEAERVAQAAHDAAALTVTLTDLESRRDDARHDQQRARSYWLDLRERRLQGMAAELAGQLTDGSGCLVCGSPTHPAPAVPSGPQVTAGAEAKALATCQREDESHRKLLEASAHARADLAAASSRAAGCDVASAGAAIAEAARRLRAAADARGSVTTLAKQISDLVDAQQELELGIRELEAAGALIGQRRTDHLCELETKQGELLRALGPGVRVELRLEQVRTALTSTSALADAVHEHARRLRQAAEARTQLTSALAPLGFSDVDDVRVAYMSDVDMGVAAALNRAYDADVRDAERIVNDPPHMAAAALPDPALPSLESGVSEAEENRARSGASAEGLANRAERLGELVSQLDDELSCWRRLLDERDLAASVAAMCSGTAADNLTRTKLSHYVLASRLEHVVAAANLRLSGICGGRYQLQHSMDRGVGDSRGGLGLLVLDTYTGRHRDPATLSGGETFYVSLALALGLADLVRDEAGGAELSTLFVDEGFGTLDSETLDEVMDEIDSLRSGGRCVGLVSHLSELRTRVPAQLQVRAGQGGSSIVAR